MHPVHYVSSIIYFVYLQIKNNYKILLKLKDETSLINLSTKAHEIGFLIEQVYSSS